MEGGRRESDGIPDLWRELQVEGRFSLDVQLLYCRGQRDHLRGVRPCSGRSLRRVLSSTMRRWFRGDFDFSTEMLLVSLRKTRF